MKKVILFAAIFATSTFIACNKESNEDLGSPVVVNNGSVNNYSDPSNGLGCGGGNHDEDENSNQLVVNFSIDNEHGTVDEKAKLLLTNKTENAVSYEWDFGNGEKSTLTVPDYSYKMHGIYTVTLKATDTTGKSQTFSQQITVLCLFGGTHTSDDV